MWLYIARAIFIIIAIMNMCPCLVLVAICIVCHWLVIFYYWYIFMWILCSYRYICVTAHVLLISPHPPYNIVRLASVWPYQPYLIIQCVWMFWSVSDLQLCLFVQAVPSVNIFILCNDRVRCVEVNMSTWGMSLCLEDNKVAVICWCKLPILINAVTS